MNNISIFLIPKSLCPPGFPVPLWLTHTLGNNFSELIYLYTHAHTNVPV